MRFRVAGTSAPPRDGLVIAYRWNIRRVLGAGEGT